jgi:hypothetical protein
METRSVSPRWSTITLSGSCSSTTSAVIDLCFDECNMCSLTPFGGSLMDRVWVCRFRTLVPSFVIAEPERTGFRVSSA